MDKLTLFTAQTLFKGFNATINYNDGTQSVLQLQPVSDSGIYSALSDGININISAENTDGTVILSVRLSSVKPLAADGTLVISLYDAEGCEKLLENYKQSPWWTLYGFHGQLSQLNGDCNSVIFKKGTLNYHLLALRGENFKCIIKSGGLYLNIGCKGETKLNGAFLAVTASTKAISAVSAAFDNAHKAGAIKFPLRSERNFPELFNYFGWCSWDAFYREVSSENIYKKLDEFKEKNIPIRWIIIDDGWMQYKNDKLLSLKADPVKFPEGLKECVNRIKSVYGVKYVGIWHAFDGHWRGIDPESQLASDFSDILYKTAADGWLIPSPVEEEKAFKFYDSWHTYLQDCGIDFLKVDNQSSSINFLHNSTPSVIGAEVMHRALERSVNKHFNGVMINCMGMDTDNFYSRPTSALSRNSDDFFPNRENGFTVHINQNVYNSIWHSNIYHCDFDMWWSMHDSAIQSGVLRAISGGPIYVSDKIGRSDPDAILPVCDCEGNIGKLDSFAMPTEDCIYTDCAKDNKLLKIFNRKDNCFAVAVYNLSGTEITDTLNFDTVNGLPINTEFVAYEYFTQKFYRINFSSELEITLGKNSVRCLCLYPIIHPDENSEDGAYILFGDKSKYVSIGMSVKYKLLLSDISEIISL